MTQKNKMPDEIWLMQGGDGSYWAFEKERISMPDRGDLIPYIKKSNIEKLIEKYAHSLGGEIKYYEDVIAIDGEKLYEDLKALLAEDE